MVDVGKQGILSIAASLTAGAAKKQSPSGVVGNVIESVTGQVKEYNKAVEEMAKKTNTANEAALELKKVEDELDRLEQIRVNRLEDLEGGTEALAEKIKNLTEEQKKFAKASTDANIDLRESQMEVENLTSKSGLLSNGFVLLAGKVAGLTTAFFSFRSMLESTDKRLGFVAKQMQLTSDFTGSYTDALSMAWEEGNKWNDTINETNWSMAKMGVSTEETNNIMSSLADGIRLTTNDAGKMRGMVGQATKDIGHMSKLLGVSTEDLASATAVASKKFGKDTQGMADDLAGMWDAMKQVQQGSKDTVVHIGDLTKAVLEQQASFQGYNFNLRQQATLMSNISAKAQEQGASYEASMAAAQGLTDILTGGAPDWAKYVSGNKLLNELVGVGKKAKKNSEDVGMAIAKNFGIDPETKAGKQQIKGLENLAKNHKKYGGLSSAYMAEEMLRNTEAGQKKMFELVKKHGASGEGRELLKRVWGLDDKAATALTLTLGEDDDFAEFSKLLEAKKGEAQERKPPTMKDVRDQTEQMVNAYGMAEAGIGNTLKGILAAITDRPWLNAIMGALGTISSGLIQVAQIPGGLKAMKGVAGAVPNLVGKAGTAFSGVAAGGGLAGGAAATGGVLAAGAVGVGVGTGLRYATDALADKMVEVTGIEEARYLSIDNLVQKEMDLAAKFVDLITFGLIPFNRALSDSEVASKGLEVAMKQTATGVSKTVDNMTGAVTGKFEEGSVEWAKAAYVLANETEEGLRAYAETISAKTGEEVDTVFEKLSAMKGEGVTAEKLREYKITAGVEVPEGPAAEAVKKGKKGEAPPVVTVTKLTAAQKKAVAQSVATDLSPEVAEMGASLFEQMATQSTEFFTSMTETSNFFWKDNLPTVAKEAFDVIAQAFETKLKAIADPMAGMEALAGAEGEGGMGGASVGPDGSILVKFMIPRDAIDKSKRQTAAATE